MKIAGIIAEYNPFHNGHAHQIDQTRRRTGCDFVVVCMAGSYTQRGEAACMDKWARARAALACGADAIFELPALWAVRTADHFARGGVAILGGLGCDALSFGCEIEDLQLLQGLARLREQEPEEISAALRAGLAAGKAHARARGEAIAAYLNMDTDLLNAPNLNLGAEYLRAMDALHMPMEVCIIKRIGGYHDAGMHAFASASAIRAGIKRGEDVRIALPEAMHAAIDSASRMHDPDDLLLYALRGMRPDQIAALPDCGEGLETRVLRCARDASNREELLERLKCKRYTRARLNRLCAHALIGLDQGLADRHPLPEYARLIGMRRDARPLLAEIKRRSRLPIQSDAAQLQSSEIFQLECRATDLRALQCGDPAERRSRREFTEKFVLVD